MQVRKKWRFFHFGVGESICKILSFIICVLTQKWYHIKAQILNFDIKQKKSQIRALFVKIWLKVHSRSPKKSVVLGGFAPESFLSYQQKLR